MKVSVVIPSFNQAQFVEKSLQSVFSQTYENIEVLFIDGGSTDGTMQIVERYSHLIDVLISEKDAGQSDALRKGFERATGDIFTWLSTDDLLLPNTLLRAVERFSRDGDCEWVMGNVVWIDSDGKILHCRKGEESNEFLLRSGVLTATGPSAFFSPRLYDRVGGVNVNLHYMMDTELWWRFVLSGAKYQRLSDYAWALRIHSGAKMSGHLFSEGVDPSALTKTKEREMIAELTRDYRRYSYFGVRPLVARCWRFCVSPRILLGLYDSYRMAGTDVSIFGLSK